MMRGQAQLPTAPPLNLFTTEDSEMSKTILQRFNEKWLPHPRTGCWIWTGSLGSTGYGAFGAQGKTRKAHRVSWEIHNGEIPKHDSSHGMCVCHKCDNPRCVNPSHLFLGTNTDNVRDMVRKGRHVPPIGEFGGASKLTEADVRAIRNDARTTRKIAEDYPVSKSQIHSIKSGNSWKHI